MGRLPVMVSLRELDKEALIRIISEPKNSLVKQYVKLFEMDGVKLVFTPEALEEIASEALARNMGARGLRSIVEKIMTPLMYETPSRSDIAEIRLTAAFVRGESDAELVLRPDKADIPKPEIAPAQVKKQA